MRNRNLLCGLFLLALLFLSAAQATEKRTAEKHAAIPAAVRTGAERLLLPAGHFPQVCVGDFQSFNAELARDLTVKNCPLAHAFFSAEMGIISRNAPPPLIPMTGTCCPLPAADILTGEHIAAESQCPDGYIATGISSTCPGEGWTNHDNCIKPLRCTRINGERYQLAAEQPGRFWGFNTTYFQQGVQVMKAEVPLAIRYALGRLEKFDWLNSGCIGYPFGSLLVKKSTKRCRGLGFRQLQYRGLPGDPPAGSPVRMFPQCEALSDPFDLHANCE